MGDRRLARIDVCRSTDLAGRSGRSILLIFFELTILTAVATLFSSFSSPALSALLTFFVFVIGHFSSSLRDLCRGISSQSAKFSSTRSISFLPNLSHFTFVTNALHGDVPPAQMLFGSILIRIVFDAISDRRSNDRFQQRNFK
jgi:hypothetical protein